MSSYQLSDVITADQFARVREIVAREPSPHRALVAYLIRQPNIAVNCARVGLLTDFFAYQLEAIARRATDQERAEKSKKLSNDQQWSLDHFNLLNEGAVWAIPRSGLMFRKEKGSLVLFARMPYTEEMKKASEAGSDVPSSAEALREYQDSDYAKIAEVFGGAGITVKSLV